MKNYIFTKIMSDGSKKMIHKELESIKKAMDYSKVFKLELLGPERKPKLDKNGEPIWSIECQPI